MTLILFLIILGAIVLVHEFGHFIFSKKFGVHVYEFSIGMGPKLWCFNKNRKKKDDTEYNLRLVPLGGFVRLAGEEVDDDEKVKKDSKLYNKSFWQRFIIMFAGAFNNFLFAFLILFVSALIFGSISTKAVVGDVSLEYPAYVAGLQTGDTILKLNDKKIKNWDNVLWILQTNNGEEVKFTIKDKTGNIKDLYITPKKTVDEETKNESYVFGVATSTIKERGFFKSISYAVNKTISLFDLMGKTIVSLFTGGVSVNDLSGPVGIYSVVGTQAKAGIENLLYLMAFLSINVGVINLLPFPAFDGGRILFLIIEKIIRKPVPQKVENTIHNIGFFLLIALMIYVTCNDIFRLFK